MVKIKKKSWRTVSPPPDYLLTNAIAVEILFYYAENYEIENFQIVLIEKETETIRNHQHQQRGTPLLVESGCDFS